ncbi:MAG TPA: hypothetical protein VIY47_14910, partial [Ignavibacteriaceae bacterium]
MEEKFSIFIPLEMEKSGKTGEERYDNMKFKGIASNPNLGDDKQGQWLDPSGFDLNDFIKSGTFNWHHRWKDKPTAIVGEPTKARVTQNNELYVEGTLYKSSQVARDIYDLAETLQNDSPNRRIGMSIEGIPTQVDPRNKNRILKARLTNIALTPSPICPGTSMEIMKGGLEDLQFEGKELLIDITQDGIRYTVDKNLDIVKAMVAGATTGTETTDKSLTYEPTKPESIDGAGKKKKKKAKVKNLTDKKIFTKGETYVEIISSFTYDSIELVKGFYNLIEDIQKVLTPNMEKVEITKEAIEKAQQILGLVKADVAAVAPTLTAEQIEEAKQAELKKAQDDQLQAD